MTKVGRNRRTGERFRWSAYCRVFDDKIYNPEPLLAKMLDISQVGVKIKYVGEPLASGDKINIHIMSFNLNAAAKVVWSNAINELDSMAGLRLMEPIPKQILIGKRLPQA